MFDVRDGETALDIAEKRINTDIVTALKSKKEENKQKESTSFSEESLPNPQPPTGK